MHDILLDFENRLRVVEKKAPVTMEEFKTEAKAK
jgi:hypothetical protein